MSKSKHSRTDREPKIKRVRKYPESIDINDQVIYTLGKSVDFDNDDFSDLSNYYNNR